MNLRRPYFGCQLAVVFACAMSCSTTRPSVQAEQLREVYSVRDLLAESQDASQDWAAAGSSLASILSGAVGLDRTSIAFEASGHLAVTAPADMQWKVRKVLSDLRTYRLGD